MGEKYMGLCVCECFLEEEDEGERVIENLRWDTMPIL